MTRRIDHKLPGSRGPFLGPDGKHVEQYQDAERSSRIAAEGGLVFQLGAQSAQSVDCIVATAPRDVHVYMPLASVTHPWRLTKARVYQDTASVASTVAGALYVLGAGMNLMMVPGSKFSLGMPGDQAPHSVNLGTEVMLRPGEKYYAGVGYTAASDCQFAVASLSGLGSYHVKVGSHAPGGVLLTTLTRADAPYTGSRENCIDVAFYTPIAGRVY